MLLDNSDPEELGQNGIYIEPDTRGYTGFEFEKAKALIDSGYREALRLIPAIKACVAASRTVEEINRRRDAFRQKPDQIGMVACSLQNLTPGSNDISAGFLTIRLKRDTILPGTSNPDILNW